LSDCSQQSGTPAKLLDTLYLKDAVRLVDLLSPELYFEPIAHFSESVRVVILFFAAAIFVKALR